MDELLIGEIRNKLVMPVTILSLLVRNKNKRNAKAKAAELSALQSLWEIVELLKMEENKFIAKSVLTN